MLLADSTLATAHVGISVVNVMSGKKLVAYQDDKYFVPASNTKIITCYAAMKYLGDSLKGLEYQVINDSTILIAGTADPTFLHPDFSRQPAFDLLKNYRRLVIGDMLYDEFLGSGWAWSDYTAYYMAQRSPLPVYGNTVRYTYHNGRLDIRPRSFAAYTDGSTLPGATGLEVIKPWDENKFTVLPGGDKSAEVPFTPIPGFIASLLADTLKAAVSVDAMARPSGKFIYSHPVDSLLRPMMYRSDNFFAEQSLLMVSKELLGEMDDNKIIARLLNTDLADLPHKPRWADGSGLSRYNLFTPLDFVTVLRKMRAEIGMNRIRQVFPTGGTGTLGSYYLAEQGRLYAKTGTLSGVVCLSGYLVTKKGTQLAFSALVNNHNGSATGVRRAVEKFLHHISEKY